MKPVVIEITQETGTMLMQVRVHGKIVASTHSKWMLQEYVGLIQAVCELAGVECTKGKSCANFGF